MKLITFLVFLLFNLPIFSAMPKPSFEETTQEKLSKHIANKSLNVLKELSLLPELDPQAIDKHLSDLDKALKEMETIDSHSVKELIERRKKIIEELSAKISSKLNPQLQTALDAATRFNDPSFTYLNDADIYAIIEPIWNFFYNLYTNKKFINPTPNLEASIHKCAQTMNRAFNELILHYSSQFITRSALDNFDENHSKWLKFIALMNQSGLIKQSIQKKALEDERAAAEKFAFQDDLNQARKQFEQTFKALKKNSLTNDEIKKIIKLDIDYRNKLELLLQNFPHINADEFIQTSNAIQKNTIDAISYKLLTHIKSINQSLREFINLNVKEQLALIKRGILFVSSQSGDPEVRQRHQQYQAHREPLLWDNIKQNTNEVKNLYYIGHEYFPSIDKNMKSTIDKEYSELKNSFRSILDEIEKKADNIAIQKKIASNADKEKASELIKMHGRILGLFKTIAKILTNDKIVSKYTLRLQTHYEKKHADMVQKADTREPSYTLNERWKKSMNLPSVKQKSEPMRDTGSAAAGAPSQPTASILKALTIEPMSDK